MIFGMLVRSDRISTSNQGPSDCPITPFFAAQGPSRHSKVLALNKGDEGGSPVSCTLPKQYSPISRPVVPLPTRRHGTQK